MTSKFRYIIAKYVNEVFSIFYLLYNVHFLNNFLFSSFCFDSYRYFFPFFIAELFRIKIV